jgi:hypothetical protein
MVDSFEFCEKWRRRDIYALLNLNVEVDSAKSLKNG